jgi:hypothetical protein
MSVWQKWSDELHTFWEQAAANYRPMTGRPGCSVITQVDVDSITYTKTTLGIPPGVKNWYLSVVGMCSHKCAAWTPLVVTNVHAYIRYTEPRAPVEFDQSTTGRFGR